MCEKCAMYEQKVYAKTFLVFFRENWRKKRASVQDKTEKVNKNYKPLSQTYGIFGHILICFKNIILLFRTTI